LWNPAKSTPRAPECQEVIVLWNKNPMFGVCFEVTGELKHFAACYYYRDTRVLVHIVQLRIFLMFSSTQAK
jgi:hypothetical protein